MKNPVPPSALDSRDPGTKEPIPPLTLTCHEDGGWFGRSKVLTEDGETMKFFYKHNSKLTGWESQLLAGGPEGPVLGTARKGLTSGFSISLPTEEGAERTTECTKNGILTIAHEFRSPISGTQYKWKNVGFPGQGSELALEDLSTSSEPKFAATWDYKSSILSRKHAILSISRDYMHELELICLTALAMDAIEYTRQGGLH